VSHQPGHPDQQQLAAFEAGELGRPERARLEAHLAACATCTELLAGAERASRLLAALPLEPRLPGGLHERLAAAVKAEIASTRERERRAATAPTPAWYRRRATYGLLGAAAAVLLLVAGVVPLLQHFAAGPKAATSAASGAARPPQGRGSASPAAGEAAAALTVLNAPDGFTGHDLAGRLTRDAKASAAFAAAAQGQTAAAGQGSPATPPGGAKGPTATPAPLAGAAEAQTLSQAAKATCVAAAAKLAPGARPAFLVTTVYQGKPATVLVTVPLGTGRSGAATQATLWVFPGSGCGQQPLNQEQVAVTVPPAP